MNAPPTAQDGVQASPAAGGGSQKRSFYAMLSQGRQAQVDEAPRHVDIRNLPPALRSQLLSKKSESIQPSRKQTQLTDAATYLAPAPELQQRAGAFSVFPAGEEQASAKVDNSNTIDGAGSQSSRAMNGLEPHATRDGSPDYLKTTTGSEQAPSETGPITIGDVAFAARIRMLAFATEPQSVATSRADSNKEGQNGGAEIPNNRAQTGDVAAGARTLLSEAISQPTRENRNAATPGDAMARTGRGDHPGSVTPASADEAAGSDSHQNSGDHDPRKAAAPMEPSGSAGHAVDSAGGAVAFQATQRGATSVSTQAAPAATRPGAGGLAEGTPTPARSPSTMRDIALQLPNPGGPRVDVQLSDRGGELHVIVRTQDTDLARDLRLNLSDLTQKLGQSGMETEALAPVETHAPGGGQDSLGQHNHAASDDQQSSGGSHDSPSSQGGDQRQQREPANGDETGDHFSGYFNGVLR